MLISSESCLFRSTKSGRPALLARLAFAVLISDHAVAALAESKAVGAPTGMQAAVFAGGCFWGVDSVFKHVKGVASVESGYAGGGADQANYDAVSSSRTGHAEAVRVQPKIEQLRRQFPALYQ